MIVDPAINVWHQSDPVTIEDPVLGKRDFIVIEDEVAGATGTGQCPNGGVHVYDATGQLEQAPVKVGYWNIDDAGPTENGLGTCTAHVFDLYGEQKLMTIAYYNGGVRVVDLSGLVGAALNKTGVGMKQLGSYRFPDSDTWSVKAYAPDRDGFHLFGNDMARGFDVYRWEPAAASSSTGTWMTAAEHAAGAGTLQRVWRQGLRRGDLPAGRGAASRDRVGRRAAGPGRSALGEELGQLLRGAPRAIGLDRTVIDGPPDLRGDRA